MKKNLYAVCMAAAVLSFSCNDNQSTSETSTVTSDTVSSAMNNTDNTMTKMETDTMQTAGLNSSPVTNPDVVAFVQKAVPGGMMEVEMGRMAATSGQSQRVKDFGNMLVQDHTAAGDELKRMATSNSIALPAAMTSEQKSHTDMLTNKKGQAFDKAYMDMMVVDHKKDIDDYKKASMSLTDNAYKTFAGKTLPVLQKHLDSAKAIRKSL